MRERIVKTLIIMLFRHYGVFKTQAVLIAVDEKAGKIQLESCGVEEK
jgi:hypothetical protein